MKKNKLILVVVLVGALILTCAGLAIVFLREDNHPQNVETAKVYSITEGDLPENIRLEMEKVLSSPGVYTFPGALPLEHESISGMYVLLTAGLVSNYEMGVGFEAESLEHVDFAVTMQDAEQDEQYLYQLYFTTAKTVTANQAALQNPAMRVGASGFNQGYLERYGDSYYIIPIMDENITNHVYQPGTVGSALENGLYEFSYEVTENGTLLTSAKKLETITKKAYVSECAGTGQCTLIFGTPRNSLKVTYDMNNSEWHRNLPELAKLGAYQTGQYTLGYEKGQVVLKDMQATMPILDMSGQ